MKETVKTSRTAGYLEKIFRAVNAKYFGGQLEEPIITIQSTPKAYGHVTVAKAWQRGDTTRHELNIGAGTLNRDIVYVVCTLVHECVHLWNLQNGIQDCSRGGAYHNKRFKEAAEARDLKISYDPRIGWSITEPTDALCEFILEQGWEDIQMNRMEDKKRTVQVVDNDCAVPIFAAFPRVFLMSTPQKAPHSISTIYRLKAGTVPIILKNSKLDISYRRRTIKKICNKKRCASSWVYLGITAMQSK